MSGLPQKRVGFRRGNCAEEKAVIAETLAIILFRRWYQAKR